MDALSEHMTAVLEDAQGATNRAERTARQGEIEKRKHRRLRVEHLAVHGEVPLASKVSVINVSASGVLLKANRRLNIGNTYLLKISYKDTFLLARAVVKWSFLVENVEDAKGNFVPFYMAGMEFKEVTSGKPEGMMRTIARDVGAVACDTGAGDPRAAESGGGRYDEADIATEAGSPAMPDVPQREPDAEAPEHFIEMIERTYALCVENRMSCFELLDVEPTTDIEAITKAYHRKVREIHPDRHASLPPDLKAKLNVVFAYLNEAHEAFLRGGGRDAFPGRLSMLQAPPREQGEIAREYFEQAKIEFWNGRYEDAEALMQHAIYLHDSSAKYYYYYAKTLLKLGKLREAERAIRKALTLESSNSDYLTEAGYIYHALGLSHRAEQTLEIALGLEPTHAKARRAMEELRASRR